MKNVVFQPWVGENYDKGINGKKVLILGESQYFDKREVDYPNFTIDLVERYIAYASKGGKSKKWMPTWTKYAKLWRESSELKSKSDFWRSVVYYNYCQKFVSKNRKSPCPDNWGSGKIPLLEVLEEFKPDLVFGWGMRLRKNIQIENIDVKSHGMNEHDKYFEHTLISGKKFPIYFTHHPSATTFKKKNYSELIKHALSTT
jgi:hypothetical protein